MKKISTLLATIAIFFVAVGTVTAAGESNCQIAYGGGEVCPPKQVKFTINKLVQKSGKGGEFVENLTTHDPKFAPGQNVNFRIVIENTGDRDITNLNVVDEFGEFLTFVAGVGNANAGAKQINFAVGTLVKGEKREFIIAAKTAEQGLLPANQTVTCTQNVVKASVSEGSVAQDSAQICIEKQVLGTTPAPQIFEKQKVKEVPATGPEMAFLFGLIPTGLAGIYLRRKAN